MYKKKYSGQAHIGEEWDSNSDSDSDDEGVATIVIHEPTQRKSLLMSDDDDDSPKCFMAKIRKVKSQSKLLDSDSDCDNLFKGLNKNVMAKIKELMDTNR